MYGGLNSASCNHTISVTISVRQGGLGLWAFQWHRPKSALDYSHMALLNLVCF